MSQPKKRGREIDWRTLVQAVAGPEPPVRVYPFRRPKFEAPNHNPYRAVPNDE